MSYQDLLRLIFLLAFLLATTEIQGGFVTTPKNTTAFVGDTVVLQCFVNVSSSTVIWHRTFRGGIYNPVVPDNRTFINQTLTGQHDLVINSTQPADGGSYTCQEGFNIAVATLILLDVEFASNIARQSATTSAVVAGDAVQLSCHFFVYTAYTRDVFHNPNCTIDLRNETSQVISSRGIGQLVNNTVLQTTVNVTETTFGPFYCTVVCNSSESVSSKIFNLNKYVIQVPATGATINTTNGSKIAVGRVLQCSAVGNPDPVYKWHRLFNNSYWQLVNSNSSLLTLTTLGQLTLRCNATNVIRGKNFSSMSTVDITVVNETGVSTVAQLSSAAGSGSNSVAIGVGVGVGVGGPVLLAAVILIVCWCRRNRRKSPPSNNIAEATGHIYSTVTPPAITDDNAYTGLQRDRFTANTDHINVDSVVPSPQPANNNYLQLQDAGYESVTSQNMQPPINHDYAELTTRQ